MKTKIAKPKAKVSASAIATAVVHDDRTPATLVDDYMTLADRDFFRALLIDWRNELQKEVDRTVGHMQDESTSFPDPSDKATQEEEFALELRTRDRERKLLKKIEEALDRIERDDFGYCEQCGVEIGVARLKARPTATLCIDCKTVDEIRERQLKG